MKIVSSVAESLINHASSKNCGEPVELVTLRVGGEDVVVAAVVGTDAAKSLIAKGVFSIQDKTLLSVHAAPAVVKDTEGTCVLNGFDLVDAQNIRDIVRNELPVVVAALPANSAVPADTQVHKMVERNGAVIAFQQGDGAAQGDSSALKSGVVSVAVGYIPKTWSSNQVTFDASIASTQPVKPTLCLLASSSTTAVDALQIASAAPAGASFWPPEAVLPITTLDTSKKAALQLHSQLLLPNRPVLMKEAQFPAASGWDAAPSSSKPTVQRHNEKWEKGLIMCIHEQASIKKPMEGGTVATVSGPYEYYHYNVDGFDDNGWGCAYRSLQTMLSWFQHKGLMATTMPNVRKIQEILSVVDSEKQRMAGFVGSKTWIGSFEVMMVLQHFVPSAECTIKRMESASELWESVEIKELLLRHFQQSKCPIMIGGSAYAHSIMGIEWSRETGAVQYLILDPHYNTKSTSVSVALSKGWCGWKDPAKFFNKDSWYNMCIPHVAGTDFRF